MATITTNAWGNMNHYGITTEWSVEALFGTYSYPVPQWLIIDTEYQMSQLLDETQSFVDLNYGMPADKGRAGI